jgi:tRNA modification GTPase
MHALTATLQTPPGRGGIAVIAMAGPDAADVLRQVFRPLRSSARPGAGRLILGHVLDADEPLDEAVLHLAGRRAEINIHGGPAVARRVLELLAGHGAAAGPAPAAAPDDLPLAHPRWNNPAVGRELLEALPQAGSELVLRALAHQWSAGLSELAALVRDGGEADPSALRQAADGLRTMRRLLEPAEVVLAGPPNAGKSTLANALTGRAVSIVHERPGTTRDWVREPALLDGVPIWLTDTAGIWSAPSGVDAEAVRRARARVDAADLVLLLEADRPLEAPAWLHPRRCLRVATQMDRHPPAEDADVAVSAVTGEGLAALHRAISAAFGLADLDPDQPRAFTDRQARVLRQLADGTPLAREVAQALLEAEENTNVTNTTNDTNESGGRG